MSDVAYADFAIYKSRGGTGIADSQEDDVNAILLHASRLLDRKCEIMPGGFAPIDDLTLYFDGSGRDLLVLRDEGRSICPLRTVIADGIRPDYDHTGDFDTTEYQWDLDDKWVWPSPRNGAATGEPYISLELRSIGDAPLTIWPFSDGAVRITGAWGWAATPPTIRELTVKLARDTVDMQRGGGAAVVAELDDGITLLPDSQRLIGQMVRQYRRKRIYGSAP